MKNFLESEKPALEQLKAMGYEYKTQQELNYGKTRLQTSSII